MHSINLPGYLAASVQIKPVDYGLGLEGPGLGLEG